MTRRFAILALALSFGLAGCTSSGAVDGAKVRAVICGGARAIETFVCGDSPLPLSSGGETGASSDAFEEPEE